MYEEAIMATYQCKVCEYIVDEASLDALWIDLPDGWVCPVCGSPKSLFESVEPLPEADVGRPADTADSEDGDQAVASFQRASDDIEIYMTDIHQMAMTGQSIVEPMRTRKPTFSWDDLLLKGAQLARLPLNPDESVNMETVIGPGAAQPMVIQTPVYITHMSFGALSPEAKTALAKGSAAARTAMCSGEGGILASSIDNAYKYIFEYVPNRYSVDEDNLKRVDAIEIKFGQSAKPGMGGHLPGEKVTPEIADIRGFKAGENIISPARFDDIANQEELKRKIDWLRDVSGGRPVGVKFAAGNIEADLEAALYAGPDFITLDGRAGATGAAPKYVKASTSVPTIFALHRARSFLDEKGAKDVSLVITGGIRVSADIAKALAMGADAVAIGTAALMAIGCQQYRVCNTGKCPMGIATQDPALRANLKVDKSARRLENFLTVISTELADFARLTGNRSVHGMSVSDLCTVNSEISNHTTVEHV
jgi:glutamate synthase domain-containing protein 2/rubredoxin